jgi:hypothetical protein
MKKFASSMLAVTVFLSTMCYADVQYTENTKMTGGAAAGAMKFAGVFSKEARQATKGTEITISVKHNKMRHEDSLGQVSIYDLDARKIIHMDLKKKSYSVMTFEEMRAQVEEAQRKAAAERAKQAKNKDPQQVKIIPKISVTPGTGNKKLLNYSANEVKTRIDMEMQAQDAKGNSQNGNMWVNADAYVAQVKAYEEVKRFYIRLAKELDWLPGAAFGGNSNVQIAQPMIEYQKSANNLSGMPLQTVVSIGMGAAPSGSQPASDEAKSSSGNPLTKGLGGVFKKKKHEDEEPAAAGTPGSLVDMQTDVTSISTDTLDASLFQVPAGFTLVKKEDSSK